MLPLPLRSHTAGLHRCTGRFPDDRCADKEYDSPLAKESHVNLRLRTDLRLITARPQHRRYTAVPIRPLPPKPPASFPYRPSGSIPPAAIRPYPRPFVCVSSPCCPGLHEHARSENHCKAERSRPLLFSGATSRRQPITTIPPTHAQADCTF